MPTRTKPTKALFALVFCAFSALTAALAQSSGVPQQTFVYVSGMINGQSVVFPGSAFQFQQWLDLFQATRLMVTTPYSLATINVGPECVSGCLMASTPGTVWAPITPMLPNENIVTGPDYVGMGHEVFGHQSIPPSMFITMDAGIREGWAMERNDLVYLTFGKSNPTLFPVGGSMVPTATCASDIDAVDNRRSTVFGGAGIFANGSMFPNIEGNLAPYGGACPFIALANEKMNGGLDAAVNAALPATRQDFAALMDSQIPVVGGVKPSTLLEDYDFGGFAQAPTGTYLGIDCGGGQTKYISMEGFGPSINPFYCRAAIAQFAFDAALQGPFPTKGSGMIQWTMTDADGNVILTQVSTSESGLFVSSQPNGAYGVDGCLLDASGACPSEPDRHDSTVIPFLDHELSPGDVAVIANGPKWGNLASNLALTVTSANASAITVEQYGALYVFRNIPQDADGTFEDISVTDGTYLRTFPASRYAPTLRYFKRRDEPILLGVTQQGSTTPATTAVRGEIVTISGWAFTHNDPQSAAAASFAGCPGSATNDQGRTQVVLTAENGKQYSAFIESCDFTSMDVKIPLRIPLGNLSISVVLNGTASVQTIPVTVTESLRRPR